MLEPDIGLGVAQVFAQRALQRQRLCHGLLQCLAGKVIHAFRNQSRVAHGLLLGVAINDRSFGLVGLVRHAQQQLAAQLAAIGRAKAYRIRHAFAFCHSVMRPFGRQIQHVAGLQNELFLGLEIGENFQWLALLQRQVFLTTDAPAALALGLQQKHVIAVEMRAYSALIGGKADHQIIEARLGHKAELLQQLVRLGVMHVHALHQHGPARLGQCRQAATRQRTVTELPAITFQLLNQARLHAILARHGQQASTRNRGLEAGDGLAHQQRLFMPMLAHELRGGEPTQQGERRIDVHEYSPAF